MKNVILLLSTVLVFSISSAQYDPQFTGEGFNVLQYNPASFGTMEIFSVNSAIRIQWEGVQGAPKTINFNSGGRVRFGSKSHYDSSKEFRLGTNYQYGEVGFEKVHDWKIAIGYPIQFGDHSRLVIAIAPGLVSMKLEPDWIPPQTTTDSLLTVSGKQTVFDLNAGIMYNWKGLYTGISSTHITAPRMGDLLFSVARHYYFDFGYKIPIGKHFIFPMVHIKAGNAFWNGRIFSSFVFKDDLFSIGAGYLFSNDITFGVAIQKWGVRIGYNYDLIFNPLSSFTSGSHEFRLSYILPLKDA